MQPIKNRDTNWSNSIGQQQQVSNLTTCTPCRRVIYFMVHEIFATGVISGGAEKVTRQRGAVLYSGQLFKGSEVIVYEAQRAFIAAMSGVWNAYVAAVNVG